MNEIDQVDTRGYGSFKCTGKEGRKFDFAGLSQDLAKLPKNDSLSTGSTALCIDTGVLYMYEQTTKQWYEQ